MAQRSTFEERLHQILDPRARRKPLKLFTVACMIVFSVLLLIPLSAMKVSESPESLQGFNRQDEVAGESIHDGKRLEELLLWFPKGDYEVVAHQNLHEMKNADAYETFNRIFNQSNIYIEMQMRFLPDFFKEDIHSLTVAKTVKMRKFNVLPGPGRGRYPNIPELFEDDGTPKRNGKPGAHWFGMVEQFPEYAFVNEGGQIAVLRFENLDAIVKKALKRKLLIKTKNIVDGRNVFRPSAKIEGFDNYYYATESQELLVADDVETVKSMIAAGNGADPGVMSEGNLSELVSLEQDLGQMWEARLSANHRAIKKYIQRLHDMTDSEDVRSRASTVIANHERAGRNHLLVCQTLKVDEEVHKLTLDMCATEEFAKERSERMYTNLSTRPDWGFRRMLRKAVDVDEAMKLTSAIQKKMKVEVDRNLIRVSATIDKELLKLAKDADKAIRKQEEELRDEKSEKAGSKKS